MPSMPSRKLETIAAASTAVIKGGKLIDERGGHGRAKRPENFTTRAASHRLSKLVIVASTAAAGGIALTRNSISRSGLVTVLPGAALARRTAFSASRKPARKLSASIPKLGMAIITTRMPNAAAHTTSLPGGYHSSDAAP